MKKDQENQRACKYFANVAHKRDKLSWKPQDIEDLHEHAKKHKYCPYYSEKFKSVFADIIFMPYNQIIDWKLRKNSFLNLENSIVILDEGHNVPSVAEQAGCFDLSILKLEKVIKELNHADFIIMRDD